MAGILIATHGGESADAAVRVGTALAARLGTTASALCVAEPVPVVDPGFAPAYVPPLGEEEALRDALLLSVDQQRARCGVTLPVHVVSGHAATEIAADARKMNADAIVLGIGPHRLIDRAFGHETALQLVQVASSPVLAVATGATTVPSHVVVAVDFSPTSFLSVRTVASWLRGGDTLHLVHVLEPDAHSARSSIDLNQVASSLQEELNSIVSEISVAPDVAVRTQVASGEPARTLLEIADTQRADLIATGSHGYGIWKRLTLGSVASKIVRLSTVSVLVTPISRLAALPLTEPRGVLKRGLSAVPSAR